MRHLAMSADNAGASSCVRLRSERPQRTVAAETIFVPNAYT